MSWHAIMDHIYSRNVQDSAFLGHVDDVDHVDHDMLTLQCGSNLDQPGRVIGDEAPVSISVREPGLPLRHPTCYIVYDILYCKYGRKRLIRWSRVWRMMQNALIHPMLALEKWFRMIILWVLQMSSFSPFSLFAETWFSAFCIGVFPFGCSSPRYPNTSQKGRWVEKGQRILRDSSCTIKRQSVMEYDDTILKCVVSSCFQGSHANLFDRCPRFCHFAVDFIINFQEPWPSFVCWRSMTALVLATGLHCHRSQLRVAKHACQASWFFQDISRLVAMTYIKMIKDVQRCAKVLLQWDGCLIS